MAGLIGSGISLDGIVPQAFAWAWNVSGNVTSADVGSLVTQDTTVANTVKLLADGDAPLGLLASFENRAIEGIKVGTVDHKGGFTVPYTGALALGNSVVGSTTAGTVKAAGAANRSLVVELDTANHLATVIFL